MHRSARRPLLAVAAGLLAVSTLAACGASEPEDAFGNRLDGATTTTAAGAGTSAPSGDPTDTTPLPEAPVVPDAPEAPVTPADAPDCRTAEDAAAVTEAPEVVVPDDVAAAEFAVDDIPGCGDVVTDASTVSVNYVLRSSTTGEIADSSFGRGPFDVNIAQGGVIPGWLAGLQGMRAGGRRTLVIPPELAYGATGQGSIPPDDTLVFVIDALSVS